MFIKENMSSQYKYSITASTNFHNIGDYLIYDSIMNILDARDETYIIDSAGEITDQDIDIINSTKALIIGGSNLYRKNDFPIKLTLEMIDKIKVPIIPFGVGAQSPSDKDYYNIDAKSLKIIKKIHEKCKVGSVRDIHTYLTLKKNGIHNIILTGCPVLFHSLDLPKIKECSNAKNLFIPQFHRNSRFTIFRKQSDQKLLERIIYKIVRFVEIPINDFFVKRFLKKNRNINILIQQQRDWVKIKEWQLHNKLVNTQNAEEYINQIKQSDYLFTFRLHAGMFGLSYGIPASFYTIDSRLKSFCKMLAIDACNLLNLKQSNKINYTKNFYFNRLLLAKKMITFAELNNLQISLKFKDAITKHNL